MRALVPVLAIATGVAACAHPSVVSYGRTVRGHCGLESEIGLEVTRKCEATLTEMDRLPRRELLAKADCDSLFAIAAHAHLVPEPSCPVSEVFSAGIAVKLSSGRSLGGCLDEPLSSFMVALIGRVAPALRRVALPNGLCDPIECMPERKSCGGFEQIELVDATKKDVNGCSVEVSRQCIRHSDGGCGWAERCMVTDVTASERLLLVERRECQTRAPHAGHCTPIGTSKTTARSPNAGGS